MAAAAVSALPPPPLLPPPVAVDVGFARTYDAHWVTGRELGRGTFAVTCEATRAPVATTVTAAAAAAPQPERAAVKIIPKSLLARPEDVAAVQREAAVMARLAPHRHIVTLLGAYEDDTRVYIVQSLCSGGELFARIAAAGAFAEADATRAVRAMMEALAHAHRKARARVQTPRGKVLRCVFYSSRLRRNVRHVYTHRSRRGRAWCALT
jgi:serine/threonine protein kinase